MEQDLVMYLIGIPSLCLGFWLHLKHDKIVIATILYLEGGFFTGLALGKFDLMGWFTSVFAMG